MRNKKLMLSAMLLAGAITITGCSKPSKNEDTATPTPTVSVDQSENTTQEGTSEETTTAYSDGTYCGFYIDGNLEQVSVQFEIKDQKFTNVTLRGLQYKDGNYLAEEGTEIQKQIAAQYTEATEYLVGKDVSALADLLTPGNIVSDQDTVTGATVRTNKLSSAIADGLNRGVYKLSETTELPQTITLADGTYRGYYNDNGIEQISVQFEVADNKFTAIVFRGINYKDGSYLAEEATDLQKSIAAQYQEAADYLIGKDITAFYDLYTPEGIVSDADVVTGATLRTSKFISAINDGMNRGVYKLSETTVMSDIETAKDGVYRGFFRDGGIEQISVQIEVKDNKFAAITLRGINYKDGNYLADEATDLQKSIAAQYKEAADYLVGKELSALSDLYTPEGIVSDADVVTGATLRSNKMVSAIHDALSRGLYKMAE